ncbi:MAG: DUF2225 domain-containing protein [Clostridium sp.]|nr:DUF2225 domain-containing protein [Clostridium sp.]
MAGLLSGLEKFGLNYLEDAGLYEEEKKEKEADKPKETVRVLKEEDYLYDKTHECPVCYATIKARTMKTAKAKLKRTDLDLRPVYENIEPLKYDVVACPHCGYTALSRYFRGLMNYQIKAIKELISVSFHPVDEGKLVFTFEEAIERYKLCLANAIVKRAKASEKAYICLKTGWLLRSMREEIEDSVRNADAKRAALKDQETEFLKNALDGFITAKQSENYPICGMDEDTVDYIIAVLAIYDGRYDVASKLISNLLASRTVSHRMKEKTRDAKEELIGRLRKRA